ncbi:hypothetical protein [Microbacterium galbinum]|uniref:Uncharacterized protein n=1 Tax=Microbacterium galbinum TaxID=2851646 RepID=A0ABY4INL7_9MICO|nr:hypothetical protein [Microbacterium galbinum]UPL14212.1 hypothetical protein KV396_06875 [Microbacterium galbinum]
MASPTHRRPTTRVLLICGALAAVHLLIHLATAPLLTALAPLAPPLYALVAGVHSLLPFLARRLTDVPGTAVLTSAIAAVFIAVANTAGVIVIFPLVLAGAVIDLVVWRTRGTGARVRRRYLLAAVCAGTALFGVSVVVFSPEHLSPAILLGSFLGRIVGELLASELSGALASALHRAGVGRNRTEAPHNSPSS